MNSLLTTIAGSFAKPLLLSALLPVVLVSSLFLALTYPLFPSIFVLPDAFTTLDPEWQVAWSTLVMLVAATLLFVLNASIVRLFSGYGWKDVFPCSLLVRARRGQFSRVRKRRDGLAALEFDITPEDGWEQEKDSEKKAESERRMKVANRLNAALSPLAHRLNEDFPYDEDLVMPTKLGNVIRNFEDYSREQYGISAVPLWPRLLGVLDARYATVLDEAKMSFDFALNCLVLLSAAAAITIGLALGGNAAAAVWSAALWRGALFALLAVLAYGAAIRRARAWGAFVKGAVDLYRADVPKKVGYQYTFKDIADEKERLWSGLVSRWSFPDMKMDAIPFSPPAPLPSAATSATSADGVTLAVARGVTPPAGKPFAMLAVTLRVVNTDARTAARQITITDTVAPNWSYVWGSAAATTGDVEVRSTAPIVIELNCLPPGESCLVRYSLQSLVASQ